MRAGHLSDDFHGLEPLLAQYWWVLFVRGALAVAFGITTLVWPELSFAVLLTFVAAWFLLDGVVAFLQVFTSEQRWPHVLDASLSIAAGAFVVFYPAMAGLALTKRGCASCDGGVKATVSASSAAALGFAGDLVSFSARA